MIKYILVPVNLEYNDEYYYPSGLGKPKRIFNSKRTAEDALYEANKEELLSTDYYDLPDIHCIPIKESDWNERKTWSDERWRRVIKLAKFPYVKLFEVEEEE